LSQVPVVSIIDDDISVRVATCRLVRSHGYVAYAFASPDEFLQSKQAADTSCVIADVQMPGMTGIELQSLLRTQGRTLPMIFITAFPDEQIRARALKAGAIAFLSKPFEGNKLIEHLNSAVGSSGDGSAGR
jgi:FixJ family two-component response regulator